MSVLNTEQLNELIKNLVTGTTDEDLKNLEDLTDTVTDLREQVSNANASENWKKRYEENDAAWRERYKQRFFTPEPDSKGREAWETEKPDEYTEQVDEGENDTADLNDLFEEVK